MGAGKKGRIADGVDSSDCGLPASARRTDSRGSGDAVKFSIEEQFNPVIIVLETRVEVEMIRNMIDLAAGAGSIERQRKVQPLIDYLTEQMLK